MEPPQQEEEYEVDKILDKRFVTLPKSQGVDVEYYIKWIGYGTEDNTWEPVGNLSCSAKIADFEQKFEREAEERKNGHNAKVRRASSSDSDSDRSVRLVNSKSDLKSKRKQVNHDGTNGHGHEVVRDTHKNVRAHDERTGFELGLTPKAIKGAVIHDDQLYYVVGWKEENEADDLAPATDVHEHCPQMLISYLKKFLMWKAVDHDGSDDEDRSSAENVRNGHADADQDNDVQSPSPVARGPVTAESVETDSRHGDFDEYDNDSSDKLSD